MAVGGAARVVSEKKGQLASLRALGGAGCSAQSGSWKAAMTIAGSADATSPDNASDDASSCVTEDLQVLEMEPAHAVGSSGRQLIAATTAPTKRVGPTVASTVALSIAVSSPVTASKGEATREVRAVAARGVPKESASRQEANGAGRENGDAAVTAPSRLAAIDAGATGGSECGIPSDADADAEHPTEGSCSTDVSTATTVASGDKNTVAASTRKRRRARTSLTHKDIDELLCDLTARAEEKCAYLAQQEAIYARGRERVAQLEREFKELTAAVDRCLVQKREHKRIERLMRGRRRDQHSGNDDSDSESSSGFSSSSSDSSRSSSSSERRRRRRPISRSSINKGENKDTSNSGTGVAVANDDSGASEAADQHFNGDDEHLTRQHKRKRRRARHKKSGAQRESKRLRRFRDDLALRFQLLQSECQRSELQVDKLVADLRREYMDSYLFSGAEFP